MRDASVEHSVSTYSNTRGDLYRDAAVNNRTFTAGSFISFLELYNRIPDLTGIYKYIYIKWVKCMQKGKNKDKYGMQGVYFGGREFITSTIFINSKALYEEHWIEKSIGTVYMN